MQPFSSLPSDSGPPTDTDTSGAWSTGSQSPTDVPSGYVLQEDTGFTIAVPEGWNREEKEKGSLEVGKLGDLIVIDRDVLTCPADDVKDTKVLLTVVGGKVVYEKK